MLEGVLELCKTKDTRCRRAASEFSRLGKRKGTRTIRRHCPKPTSFASAFGPSANFTEGVSWHRIAYSSSEHIPKHPWVTNFTEESD